MNTEGGDSVGRRVRADAFGTGCLPAQDELSEKAVKSFMEYAWSLTPQQFSKPDGSVIVIDKTKKNEVAFPIDVARNVIMAGRLWAHAQICDLLDDQISNHQPSANAPRAG